MRKSRYSESRQRSAVRALESGKHTWREVASKWDVSTGLLARWRKRFGTKPARTFERDVSEQYHSIEFKRNAVRMLQKVPMMTLVKRIGVTDTTLRAWRRQFGTRKHKCPCCRCYVLVR
jgi:transposase-like protein